jgi:hypothetical protein
MTSELPPDRWAAQDHAVLVDATRRIEERGHMVAIAEVAHALQLDIEDVMRSARNLNRGEYVTVIGGWGGAVTHFQDVTKKGLHETGLWPTPESALDRMIAALEAIADHTDDEDTRTRARKILDGMTGAGRHIGLAAAIAVVTGQLPT